MPDALTLRVARVQTRHDGKEVDLARSLTLSGLAWHSRRYDTSKALIQHEGQARDEGINVWSRPDPVPSGLFTSGG